MNITSISILDVFGGSEAPQPFSLQSATWSYLTTPYALRPDGCRIKDGTRGIPDGTQNCSIACVSVNEIFRTGATFQNCLAYPSISKLLADDNATAASVPGLSQLGIRAGDWDGSRTIISRVTTCLQSWADTVPWRRDGFKDHCGPFINQSISRNRFPSPSDVINDASIVQGSPTAECLIRRFCANVADNATPNTDIAGIGIFLSYIFQVFLLVLYCVAIDYFRFPRKRANHKENTEQRKILRKSAIEFHMAQCYFMATINIAAIIAIKTTGLQPQTLQHIFNDKVLLNIISIAGSLPIMFMFVKLRLWGHRSMPIFALSTIVLGLAVATLFVTAGFNNLDEENLLQVSEPLIPDCRTINPGKLCLSGLGDWKPGPGTVENGSNIVRVDDLFTENHRTTLAASVISIIAWLLVLIDFLRRYESLESQFAGLDRLLAKDYRFERWVRWSFYMLELSGSIGTLCLLIIYFSKLVNNVGYSSAELLFSQLTGILIWVPSIVHYVYLQFCGTDSDDWRQSGTRETSQKKDQTNDVEGNCPAGTELPYRRSDRDLEPGSFDVPNRTSNDTLLSGQRLLGVTAGQSPRPSPNPSRSHSPSRG